MDILLHIVHFFLVSGADGTTNLHPLAGAAGGGGLVAGVVGLRKLMKKNRENIEENEDLINNLQQRITDHETECGHRQDKITDRFSSLDQSIESLNKTSQKTAGDIGEIGKQVARIEGYLNKKP